MRKVLVSFGQVLVAIGLFLSFALSARAATANAPAPVKIRGQVVAVAEDSSSLEITEISPKVPEEDWRSLTFTATDPRLQAEVQGLEAGDLVWVTASGGAMQGVAVQKESVSFLRILVSLLVPAALIWFLGWITIRGTGYGIARFLVGRDNRYSKSKFQIALWFWTVVVAYLATLYLRWWAGVPSLVGGVDIPENLLLLSGISALSFGTAKGIAQGRENRAAAAGVATKPPADHPRFPTDLVCDDSGQPDLGDFQMVVITLAAVGIYLVQMFDFLSLLHMTAQISMPDVDPTLLGIFGISHGAYLTKKAVSGDDGAAGDGQERRAAAATGTPQPGQPGPV